MALGPATVKVEFYINGAWVDASPYVALSRGVTVRPAQRPDMNSDVEAGSASFTLYCHDGVWWPDNPAGPYAGKLVEGLPCRISVTIGTTVADIRHLGKVRLMEPELIGSVAKGAACAFTSTDVLSDLGGLVLQDRLSENLRYFARPDVTTWTDGAQAWDSWPLTDEGTSGIVRSARYAGNDGRVVQAVSGAGTVTFNTLDGSTHNGPLSLPSMVTFEPVNGVGPVLVFPVTGATAGQIWMAFRTQTIQDATIASGWDYVGNCMFRVRQTVANNLELRDGSGTLRATWDAGHFNDGQWHTLVFFVPDGDYPGNQIDIDVFGDDGGYVITGFYPGILRTLIVGAGMNPGSPGKQSFGFAGDATMLGVMGAANIASLDNDCAVLTGTATHEFNVTVREYVKDFIGATSSATVAVTAMNQAHFAPQGQTVLAALHTIARTSGGQVWVDATAGATVGAVHMWLPEEPAPNFAPAFTLTLTNDDDGTLPFIRGADNAPTRAVASSPLANATYVGDESTRRLDDSIDTFSISQADAYAAGGGWVNRPRGGRISPIGVDLATAQSGDTLAVALLAAIPFVTTFTLGNQPSELTGQTQSDQLLIGWEETYTVLNSVFSLSCMPALQYPRAVFDASLGGRFGAGGVLTVTNGASLGTGTGALTVASTGALMVTGTAVTWNWNGEAVTGTASGASSPQTLTISARAQLGTIARTHADGETLDVWAPAVFGY